MTVATAPQLSKAIRSARLHRGLTQQQLADRIGCTRSKVSRVERERQGGGVSMMMLQQFAKGLSIEPWKLLRFAYKLNPQTKEPNEAEWR